MHKAFAALCLIASPVCAENLLDSHFGNADLKSSGCFVRSYSKAHLAKHPDQVVTDIALSVSALGSGGRTPMFDLFVTMRGDMYQYHALAYCKTKGNGLNCQLEGDGGAFNLAGEKAGVLRLSVGKSGLGFEGDKFVEMSGTQGDDRVFLIPNVSADRCN